MIRYSAVPDLQKCFDEDVTGTAMTHLDQGLYEAHARDEAGFEDEGGHKQMWFAARDVAFENPVTEDETQTMLERMGIPAMASGGTRVPTPSPACGPMFMANRLLPDDIDVELEIADRTHDQPAAHRDLGLPHLRLGRGGARRPRPRRR